MKYAISNTINTPLDKVVEKFLEPDGAMHWMDGLTKIERLSGNGHEVGVTHNFHFSMKGKDMVIHETIIEQNLPHQIKFAYQSPMGNNEVEMIFEPIGDNQTKQINNSYFEFKGVMKILSFLMKGMFKKQSMVYLNGFKAFVEKDL